MKTKSCQRLALGRRSAWTILVRVDHWEWSEDAWLRVVSLPASLIKCHTSSSEKHLQITSEPSIRPLIFPSSTRILFQSKNLLLPLRIEDFTALLTRTQTVCTQIPQNENWPLVGAPTMQIRARGRRGLENEFLPTCRVPIQKVL